VAVHVSGRRPPSRRNCRAPRRNAAVSLSLKVSSQTRKQLRRGARQVMSRQLAGARSPTTSKHSALEVHLGSWASPEGERGACRPTLHRTGPATRAGEFKTVRFRVLVALFRRAYHESTRVVCRWGSGARAALKREPIGEASSHRRVQRAPGSALVACAGAPRASVSSFLLAPSSAGASQPPSLGLARHIRCARPPRSLTRSSVGTTGRSARPTARADRSRRDGSDPRPSRPF